MQGGKRIPCYSLNYTVVGRWFAPATVGSLSFPLQQLFLSVHYRNRTYLTSKTNLPNLCGLSCATGKTTLGPFRTTELSLSLKVVWGVSNREAQKWSRVLSFQFCLCFQKRKKKLETRGLNKQVLWLAVRKVDSKSCNTVSKQDMLRIVVFAFHFAWSKPALFSATRTSRTEKRSSKTCFSWKTDSRHAQRTQTTLAKTSWSRYLRM